ncbi:DUF5708 family protein [Yinghuangia soli]|uniref:DUF5708 family protein n=1 Tax=Yinghuangia soli TaxID=2908204 RepID=A0AA41U2C8_9ACTN|nr:DUF5708 family protein [Yinghuangia soli]MCF2530566.1 DUF5708 family protein [Yinghuangia soli]
MRDVVIGTLGIVLGLVLKLYAGDVDLPGIALDKLGLILVAVGALDLLFGIFRIATKSRRQAA